MKFLQFAAGVWDRAKQTPAGISLVTTALGAVLLLAPTIMAGFAFATDAWVDATLSCAGCLMIAYGLVGLLGTILPRDSAEGDDAPRPSSSPGSEHDTGADATINASLINDGRDALAANPVEVSNIEEFLTALVAHRHGRQLTEIGRDITQVVQELGQDFWVTFHLADVNTRSLTLYAASWNAPGRAEMENMSIPFGLSAVGTAASNAEHWIKSRGKLPDSVHVDSSALTHPFGTNEGRCITQGATECLSVPVVPWQTKPTLELTLDGEAQGKYLLGILTYWSKSESVDVLAEPGCRGRQQKTARFVGALLHLNLGEDYIEDNAELFAIANSDSENTVELAQAKPSKPRAAQTQDSSKAKSDPKKGKSGVNPDPSKKGK